MILIFLWTLVDVILNKQIEKERERRELELQEKHKNFVVDLKEKHNELLKKLISTQKDQELWKTCLKERASGFPTLMNILEQREEYLDSLLPHYLETKPHPAYSAAEAIKITNKIKREANFKHRTTQSIIEYYEQLAPFLVDLKNEEFGTEKLDFLERYTEEESHDPVINFVTKDEYQRLSASEKNQLALERYWKRKHSPRIIGKMYERYVGYLYENQGYEVSYHGIAQGLEDLGRDLICKKGHEEIIVQCKNWSRFSTIHEKHIFQLFGTVFQYRMALHTEDASLFKPQVEAVFYTSTTLSEVARAFATMLNIELKEGIGLDKTYPCIKCNISNTGEKIYHLPFDQQYDRTKIIKSHGEFYCSTVKEAEDKGFRRAFRWKSSSNTQVGV